ncbi:MAG: 23S rRNA (guanosine(2251)-2'-O)-methyltransferase RlmB [Prochlorococcus sp.]
MSSRFDRRPGKSSPGGPSRGGPSRGGPSRGGPSRGGPTRGGGPGSSRRDGGRRDGDGASGRSGYSSRSSSSSSSSGRASRQGSVYRIGRDEDAGDGSAGRFDTGRSQQGRFSRDRRDRPRSDQGRSVSREGSRQFRGTRPSDRTEDERFGKRPSWGGRSRSPDKQPPTPRLEQSTSARAPEAEAFGPAPADDLLWGRHATQAALEAGRPIHRIWCTSDLRSAPKFLRLLREAKSSGVLVEEVTWARLGQLTGGAVHQGIVLQTAAAETLDLQSLIEGCAALGEPPLLLALDGLTDPHNLGAIVRSAEALGAHGVVLPQRRSAGLTGSVAKVAAGALEHLPVARVVNLNRSLEALKQAGYRVIGLADEGDITLPDVDLEGPLVVVTGSEDQGLSLLTRRHCDQLVRIPLRGVTPSLNASVATAMCLYEVARRSWMEGVHGQAPSPRIVRPQCAAQDSSEDSSPMESELIVQASDSSNSLQDDFELPGKELSSTLVDQQGCSEDVQPATDFKTGELQVDLTPMGDEDSLTDQS